MANDFDYKDHEFLWNDVEKNFKDLLEFAPDAMVLINNEGKIYLVNTQTEKMFGYRKGELDGRMIELLIPEKYRDKHIKYRTDFFQKPITRSMGAGLELLGLCKDGSEVPIDISLSPLNTNEGLLVMAAIRDITDRKKAENKLKQSEKELNQIVEAIPQLILVLSPDGTPLYLNNLALKYTGLTKDDVKAGNFRKRIIYQQDLENLREERRLKLFQGVPFEMEQRVLRKDGQYRWMLTLYKPLLNETGHVIRWYVTGTDIDDRKRNEESIRNENIVLREEINKTSKFEIIGTSDAVQKVFNLISLVAVTNSTVLLLGETGTGKELIARAIHNSSPRKDKVMVKVNCAALPPTLIESELFGHEKGSFSGAIESRAGKFELANHTTLFLDEIGELSLDMQVKLLRAIQEKEIERIGGNGPIKIDVRIIAATNINLQKEVQKGNFRSDLFYRINVFPITIPALRDRKEDIPALLSYFLERFAKNVNKGIINISPKVIKELMAYNWPGNVRELEHLIERSVILCSGGTINEVFLPAVEQKNTKHILDEYSVKTIYENEREHILEVIKRCKGKISGTKGAAELLHVPVSTLNSKIKKFGITKEEIFSKAI